MSQALIPLQSGTTKRLSVSPLRHQAQANRERSIARVRSTRPTATNAPVKSIELVYEASRSDKKRKTQPLGKHRDPSSHASTARLLSELMPTHIDRRIAASHRAENNVQEVISRNRASSGSGIGRIPSLVELIHASLHYQSSDIVSISHSPQLEEASKPDEVSVNDPVVTYLNTEFKKFMDDFKMYAKYTEARRVAVKNKLVRILKEVLDIENLEVKMHGSSQTGLITPFSDMDLTVSVSGEQPDFSIVNQWFQKLIEKLNSLDWARDAHFVKKSKIPILQFEANTTSPSMYESEKERMVVEVCLRSSSFQDPRYLSDVQSVDIIFKTPNSNTFKSTELQSDAVKNYPEMFSLTVALKYYLGLVNLKRVSQGSSSLRRRSQRLH